MVKADTKFIRKWVAALRSGEFEQCKAQLYNGSGYCCLGVAAVLKARESKKSRDSYVNKSGGPHESTFSTGILLSDDTFKSIVGSHSALEQQDLAGLNDREGYSFSRIASYLERRFLRKKSRRK